MYHNIFVAETGSSAKLGALSLNAIDINKCLLIEFSSFFNGELIKSLLSVLYTPLHIHLKKHEWLGCAELLSQVMNKAKMVNKDQNIYSGLTDE